MVIVGYSIFIWAAATGLWLAFRWANKGLGNTNKEKSNVSNGKNHL
ncbi:hypothetical protein LCGC14_0547060 [marine sediment metagenome]|uniref:Uncharacterized protein n=1 Tax=marine sediment metagenome TaxID=412755 RepID=A0A0F9RVQ2_9ZZZZ